MIFSYKKDKGAYALFLATLGIALTSAILFLQKQTIANQAKAQSEAAVLTWNPQTIDATGNAGSDNAVSIIDTNTIFIAYNEQDNDDLKFAKSTDGGLTWDYVTIDTDAAAYYLDMEAFDANTIYIAYSKGGVGYNDVYFAKSTDGGDTWNTSLIVASQDVRSMRIDVVDNDVNTILVAWYQNNPSFDNRFSLSTNGGTTWSGAQDASPGNPGSERTDVYAASSTNIFVADSVGGQIVCRVSTNSGAGFTSYTVDPSPVGSLSELSIDGVDGNTIFVSYGTPVRVAKSVDGCQNWSVVNTGGNASAGVRTDLEVIDANTIIVGAATALDTDFYPAVLVSEDGGANWEESLVDTLSSSSSFISIDALDKDTVVISYYSGTVDKDAKLATSFATAVNPTAPQIKFPPSDPIAQFGLATSTSSIEWYFTDTSSNEIGFRLLDSERTVLAQIAEQNATSLVEENLHPNTNYAGRKVVAYNANYESISSRDFESVTTLAPEVTPIILDQTSTSLTLTLAEVFPNIELGNSGVKFELTMGEGIHASQVTTIASSWVKTIPYTFTNLDTSAIVSVSAKVRNQDAIESPNPKSLILETLDEKTSTFLDNFEEGDIVRSMDNSTVYYVSSKGTRHVFPNQDIYFSWFETMNSVKIVEESELNRYPLGKSIYMRPGTWLVKIVTDEKVYVVEPGGVLRWIPSELIAEKMYGGNWNTLVKDLPDTFFTEYTIGPSISSEELEYGDGTVIVIQDSTTPFYNQDYLLEPLTETQIVNGYFQSKFFVEIPTLEGTLFKTNGGLPDLTFEDLLLE